jgi:hypothetical protein
VQNWKCLVFCMKVNLGSLIGSWRIKQQRSKSNGNFKDGKLEAKDLWGICSSLMLSDQVEYRKWNVGSSQIKANQILIMYIFMVNSCSLYVYFGLHLLECFISIKCAFCWMFYFDIMCCQRLSIYCDHGISKGCGWIPSNAFRVSFEFL